MNVVTISSREVQFETLEADLWVLAVIAKCRQIGRMEEPLIMLYSKMITSLLVLVLYIKSQNELFFVVLQICSGSLTRGTPATNCVYKPF